MGREAREASGCEEVTVLADRGHYNGDEVLACEGTGILPVIPKTQTSGNPKRGLSPWRTLSTTPRTIAIPAPPESA